MFPVPDQRGRRPTRGRVCCVKPGICQTYASRRTYHSLHITGLIRNHPCHAPLHYRRIRQTICGHGFWVDRGLRCSIHHGCTDLVRTNLTHSSRTSERLHCNLNPLFLFYQCKPNPGAFGTREIRLFFRLSSNISRACPLGCAGPLSFRLDSI